MAKQLIYEPMTAFTDLLITLLGSYFAWKLFLLYGQSTAGVHLYWGLAFVMVSIGALLGAVSHGVGPHFAPFVKNTLWKLTTLSIGGVSVFFLMTVIHHLPGLSLVFWIKWIPVLAYLIYFCVILVNDQFLNVILFYVPIMIIVLMTMLYSQFSLGTVGSGYISIGIIISFIGAGVQASRLGLHQHFNHNDIYHVIQMIGMGFFYHGATLLTDLS